MNERQMCRKCFCLGYDLVPVNGEWSCLEHLSGHEAGAEIVRLNEQLAERTLQHQTQLDNALDLTARLAAAEALASYEVAVRWRDKCWDAERRLAAAEAALAAAAQRERNARIELERSGVPPYTTGHAANAGGGE